MPVKPIKKALREAKTSVLQIALFHSALDTLVVVMLGLLVSILLTLPFAWAFLVAFIYAIIHTYGQIKEVNFGNIEKKSPELEEQLRTVADNQNQSSEILQELNAEVLKKMKQIHTGAFVNFGRVARELMVIAICSFIIIGTSAYNVQFLDVRLAIQELQDFSPYQEYNINQDLLEYEESQNLSEILGDESIAELGRQQLDLELNSLKSDVDIGSVNPPSSRNFREVPPPSIRATGDQSYEENIPKQYQQIVRTYFKEITNN